MIPGWALLNEQDQSTFRATVAFLNSRLADPATVDWALRLKSHQRIERIAVEDLLSRTGGQVLDEPWATAWRLIEESWFVSMTEERPSEDIYNIQRRLGAGDRSGVIISKIVGLVQPWLKVTPIQNHYFPLKKKPRRPKSFDQLLSARLSSGNLVDVNDLKLACLTDVTFLVALGNALESAINHGLAIAKRLGWDGQRRFWRLGEIGRVYYVHVVANKAQNRDPDTYHRGIAPSVKLLYAVFERIFQLSPNDALQFVQRWKLMHSPIHTRLWAAAARIRELVSAEQISIFLSSLDDYHFWDVNSFPEIAELRALTFADLNAKDQKTIAKRLQKGPPRNNWPKKAEAEEIKIAQTYSAVRELQRIEVAGGVLPLAECMWKNSNINQFADLVVMKVDEGLPKASEAYWVAPNPDSKYDSLNGIARLRALEAALSTSRGWNDDPAERANEWLQQLGKALLVLDDLEMAKNGGDEFPRLWSRFGWAHTPRNQDSSAPPSRDLQAEANRVLALLEQLSKNTQSAAIEGLSAWLDDWKKQVVATELGLRVWLQLLPIAVEATNLTSENADDSDLSVGVRSVDNDRETMDLDALNTPIGKLTGVFLEACPPIIKELNPFEAGSKVRQFRDAVIAVLGRSSLIVRHRLIEVLPYFLKADRAWAQEHLITPLLKDDTRSLALWRAIARRTHFTEVLEIIGEAMSERATDLRLERETRRMLMFSLVIESLHAFRENREPAVPNSRIQQTLRTVDDEIRASAANAVQQFVKELSSDEAGTAKTPSAAMLFVSAVAPFLKKVWPQERSLVTPGVSGAFASLPATSGDAFVVAVEAVERFLVPFKCWSMLEYGLFGEDRGERKLGIINNEAKARALLRLLDLTIESSERAVVPYDLTEALDQIQTVAPGLIKDPVFRRLSTAARR
jgi:hypothetical protein